MQNISTDNAIERVKSLSLNNVRHYTASPELNAHDSFKWQDDFIQWLENEYKENINNFAFIVAEYNKSR